MLYDIPDLLLKPQNCSISGNISSSILDHLPHFFALPEFSFQFYTNIIYCYVQWLETFSKQLFLEDFEKTN